MDEGHSQSAPLKMSFPVSRLRGLARGLLWTALAALLGTVSVSLFLRLDFRQTGTSNRIVEYSVAVLLLPMAIGAMWSLVLGLRWLLLLGWLGRVCVEANTDGLTFRLGPFGTRFYDADRLHIRYPDELDEDEAGFEQFLSPEEMRQTLLPLMRHPAATERLDWTMARFLSAPTEAIATRLYPIILNWRRGQDDHA